MKETQQSISEWADRTFGKSVSNLSLAIRAQKELKELIEALESDDMHHKAAEEVADVFICLYRLAHDLGRDVHYEVDRKMAINRGRKWMLDGNGCGYHE